MLRHDEIADHGAKVGGECGEDVQRLGVQPPAALQRLAVDGDVAGAIVAECECAERLGQGIAVERAENIT